jgi:cytochrome c-type biogenesis protein CcmH/NrfG
VERNGAPSGRDDSQLSAAAEARRERRRRRSRKKKRSARLTTVMENLGWIILGIAIGVPLLAATLYLASR